MMFYDIISGVEDVHFSLSAQHIAYRAYCISPSYRASYASAVLAVIVSVCLSVCPSVCHMPELYKDG